MGAVLISKSTLARRLLFRQRSVVSSFARVTPWPTEDRLSVRRGTDCKRELLSPQGSAEGAGGPGSTPPGTRDRLCDLDFLLHRGVPGTAGQRALVSTQLFKKDERSTGVFLTSLEKRIFVCFLLPSFSLNPSARGRR